MSVTTIPNRQHQVATVDDSTALRVMNETLYPGAKPESVRMVLSYCKARGLDPLLKPVHIVPMYVKDAATGQGAMRDVVLPGIPLYRIQAARTGSYAGKSEPEYGPDVTRKLGATQITYPQWCKVTVTKLVGGVERPFTAKEYWLENYATARKDAEEPNAMWRKRPYGQLAKCAEAQALRMAFPEETGGEPTAEEMEGKSFEDQPRREPVHRGQTIDARAEQPRVAMDGTLSGDSIPSLDETPVTTSFGNRVDRVIRALPDCGTVEVLAKTRTKATPLLDELEQAGRLELRDRLLEAFSAAAARLHDAAGGEDVFPGDTP